MKYLRKHSKKKKKIGEKQENAIQDIQYPITGILKIEK